MTWRGPGNLPGLRRVGELKGEVSADLGSWWKELRTVVEGWLRTGVSGIPLWKGLYILMNKMLVQFLSICEKGDYSGHIQ